MALADLKSASQDYPVIRATQTRCKMPLANCFPSENGQFHAWRQTSFACAVSLILCIASAYAVDAPCRHWPVKGTTMLTGLTAFCELSNENQHLAHCAPTQAIHTSSPQTDRSIARSYNISTNCCESGSCWQNCKFHLQDHMPTASKQSPIPPEPDRQVSQTAINNYTMSCAGKVTLQVEERDLEKFGIPIFDNLDRLEESRDDAANRFKLAEPYSQILAPLVTVAEKIPPIRSTFQLGLAAGSAYQNSLVTQLPMPGSISKSFGWASTIQMSLIVKTRDGPQATASKLRTLLIEWCSKQAGGEVILDLAVDQISDRKIQGVPTWIICPKRVDVDLVPQLLGALRTQEFMVLDQTSGKAVLGSPNIEVVHTISHNRLERDQSTKMRVDIIQNQAGYPFQTSLGPQVHAAMREFGSASYPELMTYYESDQGKSRGSNSHKSRCNLTTSCTTDYVTYMPHIAAPLCNKCSLSKSTCNSKIDNELHDSSALDRWYVHYLIHNLKHLLNAGCDGMIAANRAITHSFLQVLETDLVETHPSQKGFVFVHSTTAEAAERLASVDTIILGIPGRWELRLRPARKQDEDSLKHAAVSSRLPRNNQDFESAQMLRHFNEVSAAGIANANLLARANRLQTAEVDINIYLFDKDGKVISAEELSAANITSVCYTPGNDAVVDLTSPSKRARVESVAGTSMVWKFADPLSVSHSVCVGKHNPQQKQIRRQNHVLHPAWGLLGNQLPAKD